VTAANRDFLLSIAGEFENGELFLAIESQNATELTVSGVLPRLAELRGFNLSVEAEIEFAASHLYEFPSSSLSKVSLIDFEAMVSHPSLKIASEDWLDETILSRASEECSFFTLFQYVRFEYLSRAAISAFSIFVSERLDLMNASIWSSLSVRLNVDISRRIPNSRSIGVEFHPNPSALLDGIIASLTRKCGGNVHDRGAVTITADAPYDNNPGHAAKNAADLTADSHFYSKSATNQWLCYDFGESRINLTHYSLRSRYSGSEDDYYPKSWVIETSIEGSAWVEVDRRENDVSLKGRNLTRLFEVSRKEECRFVRLRQIGTNHCSSSDDRLVISGFELFGELKEV
jgi:hypothetical protein